MIEPTSSVLYLFADQIADVLPYIQDLGRRAGSSDGLRSFLRSATDSLRKAMDQASFRERQKFPSWDTLTELATAVERDAAHCPALKAALCCISQLGHVILLVIPHSQACTQLVETISFLTKMPLLVTLKSPQEPWNQALPRYLDRMLCWDYALAQLQHL